MLILTKPFESGDRVRVFVANQVLEGVVEKVGVRYVELRDKEGNLFLVPSTVVFGTSLLIIGKGGKTPEPSGGGVSVK